MSDASDRPDHDAQLQFVVTADRRGDRGVVVLEGELDHHVAVEVSAAVEGLVADTVAHVEVDASQLGFVDSAGLAALLRARVTATSAGATFEITGSSATLRRTIGMAGLGDVLLPEG